MAANPSRWIDLLAAGIVSIVGIIIVACTCGSDNRSPNPPPASSRVPQTPPVNFEALKSANIPELKQFTTLYSAFSDVKQAVIAKSGKYRNEMELTEIKLKTLLETTYSDVQNYSVLKGKEDPRIMELLRDLAEQSERFNFFDSHFSEIKKLDQDWNNAARDLLRLKDQNLISSRDFSRDTRAASIMTRTRSWLTSIESFSPTQEFSDKELEQIFKRIR